MQPQTQGLLEPPKLKRQGGPPEPLEGVQPGNTLILDSGSTLGKSVSPSVSSPSLWSLVMATPGHLHSHAQPWGDSAMASGQPLPCQGMGRDRWDSPLTFRTMFSMPGLLMMQ